MVPVDVLPASTVPQTPEVLFAYSIDRYRHVTQWLHVAMNERIFVVWQGSHGSDPCPPCGPMGVHQRANWMPPVPGNRQSVQSGTTAVMAAGKTIGRVAVTVEGNPAMVRPVGGEKTVAPACKSLWLVHRSTRTIPATRCVGSARYTSDRLIRHCWGTFPVAYQR